MARFSRIQTALAMADTGLVPVFYHTDYSVCLDVVRACYKGGVRVFEFTNRGDFAHELFGRLIKEAQSEMPELLLGVGSIQDEGTAALYIQCGAQFIVAPSLNPAVARVCNRRKVLWVPGCGSVSEIGQAEELGAEIVKIFPGAQVGGPKFVEAVKGPMPWTSIMPTGGVEPNEASLKPWFLAGVTCVGIGSQLITKEVIARNDWNGLSNSVKECLNLISSFQNKA